MSLRTDADYTTAGAEAGMLQVGFRQLRFWGRIGRAQVAVVPSIIWERRWQLDPRAVVEVEDPDRSRPIPFIVRGLLPVLLNAVNFRIF